MDTPGPLSEHADTLLELLAAERSHARRRGQPVRHVPDHEIAKLAGIEQRHVIDAAGALLAAGHLALADGRGRWLGTLEEARTYQASLHKRGVRALHRLTLVKAAIAAHEAAARPAQLSLF